MDTILDLYETEAHGPKYRAVAEAIRRGVSQGRLDVGERLPPVRDLAWRLGMTPGTVARAYTILTDEGLLQAEVGRGTFVSQPRPERGADPWVDVDAVPHGQGGDVYEVNLVSPHLPNVGQARLVRTLLAQVAQDPPSGIMHYPTHSGCLPAREAVARYLSEPVLGRFGAEDVVLSHGGQSAITMVMQAVLEGRRPVVLIEELAYPGFRRAAELMRAEVVSVPMDAQGMIPYALEEIARRTGAQLVCLSAEVQNPTLICMPTARREALAEVARRCGLQILEDDCYRLGPVHGPSFRALAPERGWYVSSLSKAVTPALRFGFAIAPEEQAARLRRAAEHGFFGLATPITDVAALLLNHPDTPHLLREVRRAVAGYVRAMVNILGRYDLNWREDVQFVWLTLPAGWRASTFARAAEAEGVRIRTAEDFATREGAPPHAVRLTVNGGVSLKSFEAALERLRVLLDNPPERIAV
ncbi:PLP-dependent aminotransferase family protein [Aestuariicoccus sp. MJ-SS9]|uniref:aminotransferase-like domain-containing protein n=1 Tax=Aestuariicoccus sp. MJ-SS9 TaxID=3079855 RepID=UPI002911056E|nr:PLP-dependent aminotransferase family protein [Aestuariicoccus sp. MJ-SS9]MDU8911553.1 PLP-dependent aminotransferase family protein [Aestuariicoccus sp. MJ-SS9]